MQQIRDLISFLLLLLVFWFFLKSQFTGTTSSPLLNRMLYESSVVGFYLFVAIFPVPRPVPDQK